MNELTQTLCTRHIAPVAVLAYLSLTHETRLPIDVTIPAVTHTAGLKHQIAGSALPKLRRMPAGLLEANDRIGILAIIIFIGFTHAMVIPNRFPTGNP
jgi:hypothetical protein